MEYEWSHKINVADVDDDPQTYHIEASAEECKNLLQRFGIRELKNLSADLTVLREPQSPVYCVTGSFEADVTQTCIITLQPVKSHVKEDIEGWFSEKDRIVSLSKEKRERETKKGHVELEILHEREDPDPVIDGQIDLGELVAQHLSLALDPYPHAEDAAFEVSDEDPSHKKGRGRPNPFEKLKVLKKEKENE